MIRIDAVWLAVEPMDMRAGAERLLSSVVRVFGGARAHHGESESSLRTTLMYTNMTARTVHEALVQKGWSTQSLPSVRTISNLLNRQDYRLRTVAKTKVQKNH